MSIAERPVGLFDSGVGGLSILEQAQKLLPGEDFIYYADQGNYPYGEKTPEQIEQCCQRAADFLLGEGVKLLVVACHTASAWALPFLERYCCVPVLGMVEPSLALLREAPSTKNLVLLGSRALVQSQLYERCIAAALPSLRVHGIDGQALVAVVEEKKENGSEVAKKLLLGQSIDTLLLACTHFSCLKPVLQEVVGEKVQILDPAKKMAERIAQTLEEKQLRRQEGAVGSCTFYSSLRESPQ
jgi:glutamate racemase